MPEAAFDPAAIAADAVALAELHGGTGHEQVRIDWLQERMHAPTERIRADSIATGAAQLRAVLAEILERD